MKTSSVLLFFVVVASGVRAGTPEVVSFDVRRTSMAGGPAEDVRKKASDFFSMPDLANRESNVGSVLQKRFPLGMRRAELLPLLRKIRIDHLYDTEMRDTPEMTVDGGMAFSMIEFDVKTYTRVRTQASIVGAQAEEAVLQESFTFSFRFAKSGALTEVSSRFSSVPL